MDAYANPSEPRRRIIHSGVLPSTPRRAIEWECPECSEDAHGDRCPHCGYEPEAE